METATENTTNAFTYDGTIHTITGTLSKESEIEKILTTKEFYIIMTLIIIGIIILLLISINAYLKANKELLKDIKNQNVISQDILSKILEEARKNNNSNTTQYTQPQPNNQNYQQQTYNNSNGNSSQY